MTSLTVTSDVFTMSGPGEACAVCEEGLERGETCVFIDDDGRTGVAHADLDCRTTLEQEIP